MLVRTRYSVYKVTENDGPPRFHLEKVEDLHPGGHPNVRVGDRFAGSSLHVRVGDYMRLGGVTLYEHSWRTCRIGPPYDDFVTTTVTAVEGG